MKNRKLKKIIVSISIFSLLLNQVGVPIIYAQEIGATSGEELTAEIAVETTIGESEDIAEISENTEEATVEEVEEEIGADGAVALTDEITEMGAEATESSEMTLGDTEQEDSQPEDEYQTTNEVSVDNQSQSTSTTGGNEISSEPTETNTEAVIDTGEAIAYANLINLINSNLINSNLNIFLLNNFSGDVGDINLKDVWDGVLDQQGGTQVDAIYNAQENFNFIVISKKNVAEVNNSATVIANSGDNLIDNSDGQALIVSGDAVALANVINLVNTTLVGSNFFVAVVNIDGSTLGDIILPAPTSFQSDNGLLVGGLVDSNNNGTIDNSVQAQSNSGFNSIGGAGDSTIVSGDATSLSNNNNFVNLAGESDLFMLAVNTIGGWTGNIYNWSEPGSVEPGSGVANFLLGGDVSQGGPNYFAIVDMENQAVINNDIAAFTNSGNNTIENNSGTAEIKSGDATSLVNILNIANVNFWRSNWFFGIVNIIGSWGGNIIFAYPDLSINLTAEKNESKPGEEVTYLLSFQNEGHDNVNEAIIEIFPDENVEYISDNSGLVPEVTNEKIKWSIGPVKSKQGGNFEIKLRIKDNIKQLDTGWRLVKSAWAAENFDEIQSIVRAKIATYQPESNLKNNISLIQTSIKIFKTIEPDEPGNKVDTDSNNQNVKPDIQISAKNNVNGYVFPNDTVTFEVDIKNNGNGDLNEAVLVHEIFDEEGNLWVVDSVSLGKIKAGKEGKVTFGVAMEVDINKSTRYFSRTTVIGKAENGDGVESDSVTTEFLVLIEKLTKTIGAGSEVVAAENTEVLGDISPVTKRNDYNLLYLLPLLLTSYYLMRRAQKRLEQNS